MDYTKLYQFLACYTYEKYDDSTPNLSLSNDLGIYGDDASDLIEAFSAQFNVDVSGFMFDDYFETEGNIITRFLINLFSKRKPKTDLRINDLKAAIQSGRLV